MIYCGDDLAKIKIIYQAFNVVSLDDIKTIFGADIIVSKLKDHPEKGDGPLAQAARELQSVASDIATIRIECQCLKTDITELIRCLSAGMGDSYTANSFSTLKSRYGIY